MLRQAQRLVMRVSLVSIGWNVALSGFKLFAALAAHSGAMLSDAVHSASDVISTLVVMAGVKLAGRDCDRGHPYGHERLECAAALLLSILLGLTGLGVGLAAVRKILAGPAGLVVPGRLALLAALLSVVVKEGMYHYTRRAARKAGSGALLADAWHHRSDALSSVGSFAGILGARLGLPVLDPLAGAVICLCIVRAACHIFADSLRKMTDKACDEGMVRQLGAVAAAQPGVLGVAAIRTRLFGERVYADLEIWADGDETLRRADETARRVHDAVEARFLNIKHCMVYVRPAPASKAAPMPPAPGRAGGGIPANGLPKNQTQTK